MSYLNKLLILFFLFVPIHFVFGSTVTDCVNNDPYTADGETTIINTDIWNYRFVSCYEYFITPPTVLSTSLDHTVLYINNFVFSLDSFILINEFGSTTDEFTPYTSHFSLLVSDLVSSIDQVYFYYVNAPI